MLPSLSGSGRAGKDKGVFYFPGDCHGGYLRPLGTLNVASVTITPNFGWYLFCGFCLALSVIAPGMSFSTLLMPLGLYTPFVDGIGHMMFPCCFREALGPWLRLSAWPRE